MIAFLGRCVAREQRAINPDAEAQSVSQAPWS
jgi:hypothetical protein